MSKKQDNTPVLRKMVNNVAEKAAASPITNNVVTNNMATRAVATVATTLAKDPALQKMIAHGSNEFVNAVVKGEVAPIYAGSMAPASSVAGSIYGPADDAPAQAEGSVHGPSDATDSLQTPSGFDAMNTSSPEPETEVAAAEPAPEPGILDSLVEHAQEMTQQPEMEQQPDISDD